MSRTGQPLKIIYGVTDDGGITFILNDALSKHAIGDIVYKPVNKTGEHEYLLPLDGQTIDGDKYKRLVDYLGSATLPNLNGRYLRADSTPGQMTEAGLPNITGSNGSIRWIDNVKDNGAYVYKRDVSYDRQFNLSGSNGGWDSFTSTFDASKSNPIYGKSTTVTPLTYTVCLHLLCVRRKYGIHRRKC